MPSASQMVSTMTAMRCSASARASCVSAAVIQRSALPRDRAMRPKTFWVTGLCWQLRIFFRKPRATFSELRPVENTWIR